MRLSGASSTDPRTSAVGRWFWLGFVALVGVSRLVSAALMSEFDATNIAYYLLNIPMALGLCLLWGYCGVLSFGQVAYFGIAGYRLRHHRRQPDGQSAGGR